MRILPAEWEKHEATWLAWPECEDNWHEKTPAMPWAFAEIVRVVAAGERVYLTVSGPEVAAEAEKVLHDCDCPLGNVRILVIPTDYGWMRDCGPQFILEDNRPVIADFQFNGWALYDDHRNDDRVAALAAKETRVPIFTPEYEGRRVVLEGGGIDVNGAGTIITTAECLLDQRNQVRNPGLTRDDYRRIFSAHFGAENVIWLEDGICGDDTHGHVDDLARFVNRNTIVTMREKNPQDVNYRALERNREILAGAVLEDGGRPEIVELPMPGPVVYAGKRLPASYANFYICNSAVIVPVFNDPNDYAALGILSDLFPDKTVQGIYARDIVVGQGTLHCLTRQQPRARE